MNDPVYHRHPRHRAASSFVWGLFLIALGAGLMMQHFGTIDIPPLRVWWPIIFVVLGVVRFVELRIGSGIFMIALAAWFYVCQTQWHGLTYANSWPFFIIAVGLKIVIQTLTGEAWGRRRHGGSCCV